MSSLLIPWNAPGGPRCCCQNCDLQTLYDAGLVPQPTGGKTYDSWLAINNQWPAMSGHPTVALSESEYLAIYAGGTLEISASADIFANNYGSCVFTSGPVALREWENTITSSSSRVIRYTFANNVCSHESSVFNNNPNVLPQRPYGYTSATTLAQSTSGQFQHLFLEDGVVFSSASSSNVTGVELGYKWTLHNGDDDIRPAGQPQFSMKPRFEYRNIARFLQQSFIGSDIRVLVRIETYTEQALIEAFLEDDQIQPIFFNLNGREISLNGLVLKFDFGSTGALYSGCGLVPVLTQVFTGTGSLSATYTAPAP